MNVYQVFTFVLISAASPLAFGANASEDRDDLRMLRDALVQRQRTLDLARSVIRRIPNEATSLSEAESTAVQVVGLYADRQSLPQLVQIAHLKMTRDPLASELRTGPPRGIRPIPLGPEMDLDDFPAASAIIGFGLDGARAVLTHVEKSHGTMPQDRLSRFALVLRRILGNHTMGFLEEERRYLPEDVQPAYERLLSMPVITGRYPGVKPPHLNQHEGKPSK